MARLMYFEEGGIEFLIWTIREVKKTRIMKQ
jgi:hypothetical protein